MSALADLMEVRERDGIYEVLVLIEEPGEWIEKEGRFQRGEEWYPLATYIARHRIMEFPDGVYHGIELGLTLADALIAEGWSPPAHNTTKGQKVTIYNALRCDKCRP